MPFPEVRYSWLIAVPLAFVACDEASVDPNDAGDLRMGVLGEDGEGNTYRLRDGVFDIAGPDPATASTEDSVDPVDTLSVVLGAGNYSVTLADGWRLERFDPTTGDSLEVAAELTSDNPVDVLLNGGGATLVTYTFFVADAGPVTLGDGTLEIDIDVDTPAGICDPAVQDCLAGEGCYPFSQNGAIEFLCAASFGVALGGECEFVNECAPGLLCAADPVCASASCCLALCNTADNICPGPEACYPLDASSPEIGYCGA